MELVEGEDAVDALEEPRLEVVDGGDVRRRRLQQDQRGLDQQRPHALEWWKGGMII